MGGLRKSLEKSMETERKRRVQTNTFLVIDGSSLLVRAFFASASRGRILQTAKGTYTNAVSGFLRLLLQACARVRPSHLFVAWDVSRDTFRRELYPAYKATRGELPLELHPQFGLVREVLASLAVMQHQDARYEADDLMGSMAVRAAEMGHRVLILTGDRDALQLVDERVTVAIMKKGISELEMYTPDSLFQTWGCSPSQITDLKGLMGDASDNIPGVPGIGEKTARKLLMQYGTLESLLENLGTLKGKLRERMETYQELAVLSKLLATIRTDVPLPFSAQDCVCRLDVEAARPLMEELELIGILRQLERFATSA
jgi:5'-3' exonuclease